MGRISIKRFGDELWELLVEYEENEYLESVKVNTEDMKDIMELIGEVLEKESYGRN